MFGTRHRKRKIACVELNTKQKNLFDKINKQRMRNYVCDQKLTPKNA